MDWKFEYWVKPLPKFLKNNPNGNFQLAIDNGMRVVESTDILSNLSMQPAPSTPLSELEGVNCDVSNTLFFDQGGRSQDAEIGIAECAFEIKKYCKNNSIDSYSVVVASGTGTTALYLEKYLPNKVYTVACVGDDDYLLQQMNSVDSNLNKPKILARNFESNFGQLDIANYKLYKKLLAQTNIEFDLLYDPIAWRVLLANYDALQKPIIYIHCGGTSGNVSMINRYNRSDAITCISKN
jgi:1-aminocyclopropane-1-carboxylate deaminase/D-cysteine desulfhydrase-like pyridoxal-dependent ACC family enzyme